MSSFTLHFSRNQAPLTKGAFALALQRLTHRALDGQHSWESPSIALGHLHLHITPEGVGEEQPLVEPSGRYALVFDGRLDNRGELATALGISPSELRFTSDAALCLHSHLKWGEAAPTHLLGEFAWAVVDLLENQVFCARDPLGDRSLYYYLDPRLLVIASEPYAVLGCPGISNELDEVTLAHYFAVQVPADGRTYFKAVRELPAAHAMRVSAREVKTWRYWTPDPGHIRYRQEGEYVEHYRELFIECVRCRLRLPAQTGILLSGGLDSPSIAAVAAMEIAAQAGVPPLTALSYTFDELKRCDERPYIRLIHEAYPTRPFFSPSDDAWPLRDWAEWPHNPNHPEGNLYRLMKERAYALAQQAGLRVVLTGVFSDSFYSGGADSLLDLLLEGSWRRAARELGQLTHHYGWGALWRLHLPRRLGGRLLDRIPGGRRLKPRSGLAPWLTPYARELLGPPQDQRLYLPYRRPHRAASLLSPYAAWGMYPESFNANRYGFSLVDPYRDRRLVEFMLAIPTHQLFRGAWYKPILRESMQGILPEPIRQQTVRSNLTPLFQRGLLERERSRAEAILQRPEAAWRRSIKEEGIQQGWKSLEAGDRRVEPLLLWIALAVEPWLEQHRYGALQRTIQKRCFPINSVKMPP